MNRLPPGLDLGLCGLRLGLLVGVLLRARVRIATGAVDGRLLLARAATVVRGVEPRSLEMHSDGIQDTLDGSFAADLALRRGGFTHPLEQLENVSVRATVLVDRHALTVAAGPFGTRPRSRPELAIPGAALRCARARPARDSTERPRRRPVRRAAGVPHRRGGGAPRRARPRRRRVRRAQTSAGV